MKSILAVLCLTTVATFAQAGWTLNQQDSNFNFASIKKNSVYESHTFKNIQGTISNAGDAVLEIDLNSVSTGIGIRDQRMKQLLFNTVKFPAAQYRLSIDPASISNLQAGQRLQLNVQGKLSLFGIDRDQSASLNIFKLNNQRIQVSTAKPIVIKAADFGLEKGVEALREIANLPVISHTVPVNFSLVFEQQ